MSVNANARVHLDSPRRSNFWPILIALAVLLAGGWIAKTFLMGGTPENILLIGVDEGKIRADVVVFAHVDPGSKLVSLIALPRDTLVEIPCEGVKGCLTPDKLAHAHVYGGEKGPEFTVKAVEKLLGVKIDHYVKADYEGFEKVVEALGGVDIVIDKNMDYEDPYAHPPLRIHFKASKQPQHLNGADALRYVRFRNDGLGDVGRIERTKKFLLALAESAKKNGKLTTLPSLVSTLWPYVHTNLDTATAVSLAKLAPDVEPASIAAEMLPGKDDSNHKRGWVWVADQVKVKEMVDRLVNNPQQKK